MTWQKQNDMYGKVAKKKSIRKPFLKSTKKGTVISLSLEIMNTTIPILPLPRRQ